MRRVASHAVAAYLNYAPLQRGKFRLRDLCGRSFLICQLRSGAWIRVSGLTDFEWLALRREPKERLTVELVVSLLHQGARVLFDVGANIGLFALSAAQQAIPGLQVHAFEPTPQVVKRLAENVSLNSFSSVRVVPMALYDREAEVTLYVSPEDPEANGLASDAGVMRATIPVRATTLDAYTATALVDTVDVLKMDCEGAEAAVIAGGRRTIESHRPVIVFETGHRIAGHATASELLLGIGYRVTPFEQLKGGPDQVWNAVAWCDSHLLRYPILRQFIDRSAASESLS